MKTNKIVIVWDGSAEIGAVIERLNTMNKAAELLSIESFDYLPSTLPEHHPLFTKVTQQSRLNRSKYAQHQGKKERERRAKRMGKEVTE